MSHKFLKEDTAEYDCTFCFNAKSKYFYEAESTICIKCLKVFRDQINKVLKIELLK